MPVESPNKPPPSPPDNRERLRAEMPQIPGVNHALPNARANTNEADTKRIAQIGGLAVAVILMGITSLWWIKRTPHGATESPAMGTAAETSAPAPTDIASEAATSGPTVAATVEELAKPWSAKQFIFVKPLTDEKLDAMVIRLPGGQLWAFAIREPYGRCDLEFVTSAAQLAKKYGYRASHPMVASPCTSTVYDPLKAGAIGGNVFARGEIVQGSGLRPPISIDVVEKDHSIIADRIE